ncbi:MAG TPA: NfeD family protein [Ktedonobacteraceae bacterium]|nr:NfeD family protein [Ktedonobacteraceae bacterium]
MHARHALQRFRGNDPLHAVGRLIRQGTMALLAFVVCAWPAAAAAPGSDAAFGILLWLHNPNIVFFLSVIAFFGLFVEIAHPGIIVPGLLGTVALVLFLIAASGLAPNWAGLAILALAFGLLVLDLKLTAHGVLSIAAALSFIVGTLVFFHVGNPLPGPQLQPMLVYLMGGVIGLLGLTVALFVASTRRYRMLNGVEGMIGAHVTALTPLQPQGRVRYGGENWAAVLDPPISAVLPGTVLQIVAVEGLCLHVRTLYQQSSIASVVSAHH